MHAGTRPSRSFVLRCAYVGTRAGVCAGHARASTGLRVWYNVVRHRALVCTGFEYDITLVATEEGCTVSGTDAGCSTTRRTGRTRYKEHRARTVAVAGTSLPSALKCAVLTAGMVLPGRVQRRYYPSRVQGQRYCLHVPTTSLSPCMPGRICRRAPYAMSGTDVGYAATSRPRTQRIALSGP
eukprot:3485296-Rhodomonas_salina.4